MYKGGSAVTLLIADDHQLIIDGLSKILENDPSIAKIYTAINGKLAVDMAMENPVDCVIMDINMPVLNGLEATQLLKTEKPGIKIIVVSMICDGVIVNKMLKAGADAFINKDTGKEELLRAIDKVMHGEKYVSPAISSNLIAHLSDRKSASSGNEKHLTPRETEIIRYIAEGLTNSAIASRLFISTSTVDTHRKNILAKLHLRNTAALVKYAADQDLL